MIINRIRAENVLKYVRLELDDLPERGLIAVIGHNESGKSSIGESICFALFGRTFSLDQDDLDKVIRWGESRCSIRLDFTTPDGQGYQIARFLDALGHHSASISRIGEEPMVRGLEETATALKEIIGFGYTELIESFYLAQREITTPNPHSFAVKVMAGVDALEKVATNCRNEIDSARKRAEETRIQKNDIDARIQALGFDIARLTTLEQEHAACARSLEEARRRIGQLKTVCEHNEASLATLKDAAGNWLSVSTQASLHGRRKQSQDLSGMLAGLEPIYGRDALTAQPFAHLSGFAQDLNRRIESFQTLFGEAAGYRQRLARLLGTTAAAVMTQQGSETEQPANVPNPAIPPTGKTEETDQPFSDQLKALERTEKQSAKTRNWSRLAALFISLPTFAAWGLWGLLTQLPDAAASQTISAWLTSSSHEAWENALAPWLPYLAALLSVIFAALVWHSYKLSKQVTILRQDSIKLARRQAVAREDYARLQDLETIPLAEAFKRLEALDDNALLTQTANILPKAGDVLLDTAPNDGYRKSFKRIMQQLEKGISVMKRSASGEIEQLHETVTERTGTLARLSSMVEREHERKRHHDELEEIAQSLAARIDENSHQIQVRELSIDLLGGAIHYISQRFNTEIRNLAADSLPKFTNGRYEHLQIDDNLKVKAFSNDKRNFMELDEISSGTQRQIMLAVRLALSQKLVNSVIQGPQMLFLDEPFAFFDEERTASSLAVLPQVSGDFTQIWVTSQTFPARSRFDLHIECDAAQSISPKVWRGDEAAAIESARAS